MLGSVRGRLLIILAVIVGAGFSLYHTYDECMETPEEVRGTCSPVKLGLDLQGGMHLEMEVADPEGTMTTEARRDATDRALQIIRTRIDQFGVSEPLVQATGGDRIIVELPGIRDEQRAKDLIQQTAFLEFRLVGDLQPVVDVLPRMDRAVVAALGDSVLPATDTTATTGAPNDLQDLVFGNRDSAETDTVGTAPSAPADNRAPLSSLLSNSGEPGAFLVAEENVAAVTRYLALPEVQRLLPRGVDLRWGNEPEGVGARLYRFLYALEDRAFMTGEQLEDAQATRDQQYGQTVVAFELNRRGGRDFERTTREHIGDRIAIVLDDRVFSAPTVQGVIRDRGQIEMGAAPLEEARDLALVLRAGALPAPLQVLEERTISASLGSDSVASGQIASIVGIVLIILMMVGYYRFAGFLAVVAMLVYVLIVLGGLSLFDAALTVPGIAGLVLSIGMAVDANVLVFERIREELEAGRTVRTAVEEGFRHAMSAIVDSNVTTLITALILYKVGTGPVQGFAVTLAIGLIASFFSAVFVTRTLFLVHIERKRAAETLSI
ncbi:MAG TPA: protein translocase subunit SecD [Longimicrobiales bacterium]